MFCGVSVNLFGLGFLCCVVKFKVGCRVRLCIGSGLVCGFGKGLRLFMWLLIVCRLEFCSGVILGCDLIEEVEFCFECVLEDL